MPDLSIIVVSYNTRDLLIVCLEGIQKTLPGAEVIVIDNASADASADEVARLFPAVKLIRNTTNRGFGAANNQGLAIAGADLVLLLNADAIPINPTPLLQTMEDETIVAAGGALLNPNGTLQESAAGPLTLWAVFCEQLYLEKLFPKSNWFSPYWLSSKLPAGGEVSQVMGACLIFRPVEQFDERYFLYCEDTDLCLRLRPHGRIVYVPEATFIHKLGSSSAAARWRSVAFYNRGKELYFRLHASPSASFLCWLINRFGALLRFIVWSLATISTLFLVARFRLRAALFGKVLFAPLSGPNIA